VAEEVSEEAIISVTKTKESKTYNLKKIAKPMKKTKEKNEEQNHTTTNTNTNKVQINNLKKNGKKKIKENHKNSQNTKSEVAQEHSNAEVKDEDGKETNQMRILYTNADQLTSSKKFELLQIVKEMKPHIIAVCEVKPKNGSERTTMDFNIDNYTLYSTNLAPGSNTGRGIAVYVHVNIDSGVSMVPISIKFEEACLLEFNLQGKDKLLFGCIYRSPTRTASSSENNQNLNHLLKHVTQKAYSHVCIVGDFNYKEINWQSWSTTKSESSAESEFLEAVKDCYLHQHVSDATRARGQDDPSLIDLVLTNEQMQISDLQIKAPLGKSDHSIISFKYSCYLNYAKAQKRYAYHKGDYEAMRNQLETARWKELFLSESENLSVEELWSSFKSVLHELRHKFVPKVCSNLGWRSKGEIPIPKYAREAIRSKSAAHRKWIRTRKATGNDHKERKEFKKMRNKVKTLMRGLKRKTEKEIGSTAKSKPKAFWSHVRKKLKTKSGVAPLLDDEGTMKYTDKEKADILQSQFSSVFTNEPLDDIPFIDKRTENTIGDCRISTEKVEEEIKNLNVNKVCGPDEVNPRMLKELASYISEPLALIFNKSLLSGTLPNDWKSAYISAIYKKGNNNIAENYRPISLTSVVCKLMESVIKKHVTKYILENDLVSPKQFGFVRGRSTATQLLSYLNECIETVASGGVVDTIYFDFEKAFDTVPHQRLLRKLEAYGIKGVVLKWIKAFLSDRSQIVKVNGIESFRASVLSGVPQGSVLGPLLFVLYINDLPDHVDSGCYLFADDTKIHRIVSTPSDAAKLQADIHALESWSKKWLLRFHADKCFVLTLGKFENITHTERYKLGTRELEHVFEQKDLGVIVDSELRFEEHIGMKVKKANSIAGLIRRSFAYLDATLFKQLFITFVRPHLEYCQAAWAPYLKRHVNQIESVQRRATKLIDGFKNFTYEERLRKLKLPTLAFRRLRGDMIELFKHFNTYDRASISRGFRPKKKLARRHDYQLERNFAMDGTRGVQRNSFYFRTIEMWNQLPRDVVGAVNVNSFKNKLDEHWDNHPLRFNHEAIQTSDS